MQQNRVIKPWKTINKRVMLSVEQWLRVYCEQVELPNGRVLYDFYKVQMPAFAVVVALTVEKKLIMVRAYKHGIGKVLLTVPAGYVEEGEAPLAAAQRELLEETGYLSDTWQNLGNYVVDGNRQCGTMHLFLASNACFVSDALPDYNEELQIVLMSKHAITRLIQRGEVPHLVTAGAFAIAFMHI